MPAYDFDTRYWEFQQDRWLQIRQQRLVDQLERNLVRLYAENEAARDRLRQQVGTGTHPQAYRQPAATPAVPILSVDQQRQLQTQRFRRHVEDVNLGNELRTHSPAVLQAAFQERAGIRLTRSGVLPPLGEVHRCKDCGGMHP